jgi:hypothetical protein
VIKFPEYIKFLPTVVTAAISSRKSGCFDILLPPETGFSPVGRRPDIRRLALKPKLSKYWRKRQTYGN